MGLLALHTILCTAYYIKMIILFHYDNYHLGIQYVWELFLHSPISLGLLLNPGFRLFGSEITHLPGMFLSQELILEY